MYYLQAQSQFEGVGLASFRGKEIDGSDSYCLLYYVM